MPLRDILQDILAQLVKTKPGEPLGKEHPLRRSFENAIGLLAESNPVKRRKTLLVKGSIGKGRLTSIPFIALLDRRETTNPQRGVYCLYLFRQDGSGVYLTLNQGVAGIIKKDGREKAYRALRAMVEDLRSVSPRLREAGFCLDEQVTLRSSSPRGRDYETSTAAHKLYERDQVPDDNTLFEDLEEVLNAYDAYLGSGLTANSTAADETQQVKPSFELGPAVKALIDEITARGFVFEPWQVAAYVTALRTKPFVILAGVTGTGKSKLPSLVAEATGGQHSLVPVRPDWTDSADVLGYIDLQGHFRPGSVLEVAHRAMQEPQRSFICVLDEMNLARVEHYFAEILSRIEDRDRAQGGGYSSAPLISQALQPDDQHWSEVVLPQNFAIVGTVNMDESAHGFSRKVLDRAFTLELSEVDLLCWKGGTCDHPTKPGAGWPVRVWFPRASRLGELDGLTAEEVGRINVVIASLIEINKILIAAQLQVGYRTRDEIAMFVLNAAPVRASFVSRAGAIVEPLDIALQMKILPRIAGGSAAVRHVVLGLLTWAVTGKARFEDAEAKPIINDWNESGRTAALPGAEYPRMASRLCLMWERLVTEGYTSFWL
jgi:hypothetical protein